MNSINGPFAEFLGGILYGISYTEIVRPVCMSFWAVLLLVPYVKTDLSDPIAATTYLLYCVATSFAVVIAAPMQILPNTSFQTAMSIAALSTAMGSFKWWYSFRKQKLIHERSLRKEG